MELFQTPVPVPTLVILALFALSAAGQQREKQTGNSNRTLKMMGLETLYGVLCLVNEDVFFSSSVKQSPRYWWWHLAVFVNWLWLVSLPSCQFQFHRDRWEKCYYLNVIAQYCHEVLLSHQSIIAKMFEVQNSDKYCNKYNYNQATVKIYWKPPSH